MQLKSLFTCMACVIALLAPVRCFAHASLIASTPRDAATVPSGHVEMELQFNSRIDAKLSRLMLVMVDNQRVIELLETISASNALKAKAPNLQGGSYTLHWQIMSVDGHLTQGKINFRVGR